MSRELYLNLRAALERQIAAFDGDSIDEIEAEYGVGTAQRIADGRAILAAALESPERVPSQALLYEHEDGRYAVNPDTAGDPKWHRVGPVEDHP